MAIVRATVSPGFGGANKFLFAQNEPLATIFPCLFCNHEKSVLVKLNKKEGVGQLSCKVCNQQYQCQVNCELQLPFITCPPTRRGPGGLIIFSNTTFCDTDLSAAVDVYSDWVDACDSVAKGREADGESGSAPARASSAPGRPSASKARDEADDDDDDDDIIDDEDGMGGYGGRNEGIVADDEDDY